MTNYDIQNLINNIDIENFKQCLADTKSDDLVKIYKAITELVGVCHKCVNLPIIVFTLSEIQYVYALEITNRYLYGHKDDIRALDIPFECLPEYIRTVD